MHFLKRISAPLSRALLGALVLVAAELVIASFFGRKELVGAWELSQAFFFLSPLGWLASIPVALAGALLLEGMKRADRRAFRLGVALSFGAFGGFVGFGVSTGRHFESFPLRAGFCTLLGLVGFALVFAIAKRLGRFLVQHPRKAAALALASALCLELANLLVLPRLYPAFHMALLALTMLLAPAVGLLFATMSASDSPTSPAPSASWRLGGSFLPVVAVVALSPFFAKKIAQRDNLRLVYLERAPLLRTGIELGAKLSPPEPLDGFVDASSMIPASRALDWEGRDIILLTIDALRADHLGSYGYSRPTTPHLDKLAEEGVVFERAYAPTPNTSYSLTSVMTGKPMRPLVLQGLGGDSDTFAKLLQGYGYRTAAFYPPAVFFVDGDKLSRFRDDGFDFEYRKIQFSSADERVSQVEEYLKLTKADRRLFLWVHLFEPHEPYVAHPEFPFGDRDIDRYDSEIAKADEGIGDIVAAIRRTRPKAVIMVTADHGEEFGDHGGRFHGTTVYEEQIRVPFIVAAPESLEPRRISLPVNTIDILPTVLSALDIPRSARIRGRDLGKLLRDGEDEALGEGLAVSETEERVMLAAASFRLLCQRRLGACALYDLDDDPGQTRDVSTKEPERFEAMKTRLRSISASHGHYERAGLRSEGKMLPDALRRGILGDGDAALEIAALLDDAEVLFRRKAAVVLFLLRREEVGPQLRLALARDEDDEVRHWASVALTRIGEDTPTTLEILRGDDLSWARLAALALAERRDPRGGAILAKWAEALPEDMSRAREVVRALGYIREKRAVPVLLGLLDDFRLRPQAARALASIGDISARKPIADQLANERYEPSRIVLAEALISLEAKEELRAPLVRFLGTPDPLPGGLGIAVKAGILDQVGGARIASSKGKLSFAVPKGGNGQGHRILVRGKSRDDEPATLTIDEIAIELAPSEEATEIHAKLPDFFRSGPLNLSFEASSNADVEAIAVVPLSDEIPPPPPEPWKKQEEDG